MKPQKVLLPLDIKECPLEVFPLAEKFAARPETTLILLHVLRREIMTANQWASPQAKREARWLLERLARDYVSPRSSTVLHVRIGDPAEQILDETKAEDITLIILPTYGPSVWERLLAAWKPEARRIVSPLAERIIRDCECGVFVAGVKTRFNCEKQWSRRRSGASAPDNFGAVSLTNY